MRFYCDCVSWPAGKVNALTTMVDDSIEVTRSTFMRHVDLADLKDLEVRLGYALHSSQGLTMAGDWHVSYHRSKLNGFRVYYLRHSSIEYVFIPGGFTWKRRKSLSTPAFCGC